MLLMKNILNDKGLNWSKFLETLNYAQTYLKSIDFLLRMYLEISWNNEFKTFNFITN